MNMTETEVSVSANTEREAVEQWRERIGQTLSKPECKTRSDMINVLLKEVWFLRREVHPNDF